MSFTFTRLGQRVLGRCVRLKQVSRQWCSVVHRPNISVQTICGFSTRASTENGRTGGKVFNMINSGAFGVVAGASLYALMHPIEQLQFPNIVSTEAEQKAGFGPHFISEAAEAAAPAVVNLTYSSKTLGLLESKIGGSGFIINADGTILTNAHVVSSMKVTKGGSLQVSLQDGRTFEGKVVSTDKLSDLAIVKVDSKEKLPTAKLGSSSNIRVGEWVVALGSPLHLQNTVTAGIISCVERKSSELGLPPGARTDYIQIDAAINQGNSGGPLVNLQGEVIGINTFKALGTDGVSFAIPIETAKFVIKQLQTYGRVVRPYIGIKMLELNSAVIQQLKERDSTFPDVKSGVLVPQVVPRSPAERAGFAAGDVIISFDGKEVSKGEDVINLLGHNVGKRHEVVVAREHGKRSVLYVISEEAVS